MGEEESKITVRPEAWLKDRTKTVKEEDGRCLAWGVFSNTV